MAIRRDMGFSTPEVLAALSLFAIVAAALTATTIGTTKANNTSKQIAVASTLIYDKIEQLRALDPAINPADLQPGSHDDALNPLTPFGEGGGTFTRTWVVSPNIPKAGLAEVIVTISWNSPEPRSVRSVAYVCRSGTCS